MCEGWIEILPCAAVGRASHLHGYGQKHVLCMVHLATQPSRYQAKHVKMAAL
jgi:hypothetical protein